MPRRVVEAVNRRGIKVRGQWVDFSEGYEGLPAEKIEVGQEYEVKFVKDEEGKWWVRCVEPVEEADSAEERERRIARMNALTNAVNFSPAPLYTSASCRPLGAFPFHGSKAPEHPLYPLAGSLR